MSKTAHLASLEAFFMTLTSYQQIDRIKRTDKTSAVWMTIFLDTLLLIYTKPGPLP
jgi:hypothetical protein